MGTVAQIESFDEIKKEGLVIYNNVDNKAFLSYGANLEEEELSSGFYKDLKVNWFNTIYNEVNSNVLTHTYDVVVAD